MNENRDQNIIQSRQRLYQSSVRQKQQIQKSQQKPCFEKCEQLFYNLNIRLLNYFQFDRLLESEHPQTIQMFYNSTDKYQRRYCQNFRETYSERQKYFAYDYDQVLSQRYKQMQDKNKNCCGEFWRLLCCIGGNYLQDIEEYYIVDQQKAPVSEFIVNRQQQQKDHSINFRKKIQQKYNINSITQRQNRQKIEIPNNLFFEENRKIHQIHQQQNNETRNNNVTFWNKGIRKPSKIQTISQYDDEIKYTGQIRKNKKTDCTNYPQLINDLQEIIIDERTQYTDKNYQLQTPIQNSKFSQQSVKSIKKSRKDRYMYQASMSPIQEYILNENIYQFKEKNFHEDQFIKYENIRNQHIQPIRIQKKRNKKPKQSFLIIEQKNFELDLND